MLSPTRPACSVSATLTHRIKLRPLPFTDRAIRGVPKASSLPLFNRSSSTKQEINELLRLASATSCGSRSSASVTKQILELVDKLAIASQSAVTTGPELSGTWKLLWTTEKETLFILDKAPFFGTTAGDVYQVIDVANQTLQNVITFPPEGAFIVDSSIAVSSSKRTSFAFQASKLKLPSTDIKLPPFGKGWFDTVYLDNKLRISQDSRGDTLIVARDGPPRRFT